MPALGDATWNEVTDRAHTYLALPLGSLEQHGPHLPLDTDTVVAYSLATALAHQRSSVLVAPPVAIGASGEHAGFAGTLSVGSEVLQNIVIEIVRSADWADGVVLVNGHGGNSDAVRAATNLLRAEGRRVLSWWPNLTDDPRADSHAGWLETSVMLHLAPRAVRMGLVAPGDPRPISELLPVLRKVGVVGVSPNGVLGDPTGATAEAGASIVDRWVSDLVTRFDAWAT